MQIIDKIWDASNLSLKLQNKFLMELVNDLKRIQQITKKYGYDIDKNNLVSGDELFAVTINLWNYEEVPGEKVFVGKDSNLRFHYFGLCPELENFVSLILWPETSKHSEKTLEEIWDIIKNKKQKKKTKMLQLKGNYRIRFPNELHPFRAHEIKSSENEKIFNWIYVPWLKETGDTIFLHKSPTNFKKIYYNFDDVKYAYVNAKVGVGTIKEIDYNNYELKIKLPYLNSKKPGKYFITKLHRNAKFKLDILKKDDLITFLIFEVIGKNYKRNYAIYDIEKINFYEVVGHLLSFLLHQKYLKCEGLYLMDLFEFKKLCQEAINIVVKFGSKSNNDINTKLLKEELLFMSYLNPFFGIVDDKIYYVPGVLLSHEDYKNKLPIIDKFLKKFPDDNKNNKVVIELLNLFQTYDKVEQFIKVCKYIHFMKQLKMLVNKSKYEG